MPPRTDLRAAIVVAACVAVTAACGTSAQPDDTQRTPSRTPSVTADAGPVDAQRCAAGPPRGAVTRPQDPFRFTTGEVAVSVRRLPTPQAPDRTPGDSGSRDDEACYVFPHSGPPDPVLPVESVVLTFRDEGSDGVILEISLADLVSRQRLSAQVGVVVDGRTYQAATCSVETTELTSTRVAGQFSCPSAIRDETNPFAPDDDIAPSDRSPEPSTAPPAPGAVLPPTTPPPVTQPPPPSATISGWFRAQG